jgi:sterol desaturase/sphingolipid hydroxylase (fatty acid hydroxylase superfamily)
MFNFIDYFTSYYIKNIDNILINFYIFYFVLLVLLFIEILVLGFKKSTVGDLLYNFSKNDSIDIFYFLLTTLNLLFIVSPLVSLGVPYLFKKGFIIFFDFKLGYIFNPIVHFLLFFIFVDFCNYWQHRLMHKFDFLWEIHKLHHSATKFNLFTVFREHPLDHALNSISIALPIGILGYPPSSFVFIYCLFLGLGYLKHGKVPYKFGLIGKYFIQAPYFHYLHHLNHSRFYNTNYANNLIIWDHLFGTFKNDQSNIDDYYIGLDNNSIANKGVFYSFFSVLIKFYKSLFNLIFKHR